MMTLELPRKLAGSAPVAESEAWRVLGLSRVGLSRFLSTAQAAVGLRGEVDVLLTGDRRLRRLNREFRGLDKATDVLSFPSISFAPSAGFGSSAGFASPGSPGAGDGDGLDGSHAGDLAISVETAQAQAAEHGHSLRDEVRVLLLHGLLHLAGMDHEADQGEMAAREAVLRQALRLPSGLIARATGTIPASGPARAVTPRRAVTQVASRTQAAPRRKAAPQSTAASQNGTAPRSSTATRRTPAPRGRRTAPRLRGGDA